MEDPPGIHLSVNISTPWNDSIYGNGIQDDGYDEDILESSYDNNGLISTHSLHSSNRKEVLSETGCFYYFVLNSSGVWIRQLL